MPSVNRTTLKGYFNLGDVPTESNFVDLIDAAVNQTEDNLTKEANGPLRIGYGASSDALQKVVEFFRGAVSGTAAWSLGLNGAPVSGNQGLTFFQGGSVRLHLNENGNMGIGTTATVAPLSFPNTAGPKISLGSWGPGTFFGFEVAAAALRILTDSHQADVVLGFRTGPAATQFTETMRVKGNGNVGIGTNTPQAKLQVVGGAIMPSAASRQDDENTGILFPKDPFGPSYKAGDSAYIRYYVRGTTNDENMTLEIGTTNDPDDHIALMPSGNVGIGTRTPTEKLSVHGGILLTQPNPDIWGSPSVYFGDSNYSINAGLGMINLVSVYGCLIQKTGTYADILTLERGHLRLRDGHVYSRGNIYSTGDFSELLESENKTPILIGTSVVLTQEGKIRPAKDKETPIGVIAAAPAILCNSASEWPHKHLKNEFGQLITEEVEEETTLPDGKKEMVKVQKPILNPNFDPSCEYIPRENRPEWHPVGLLGQLHLRKGQPVAPSWIKIQDVSENVELWLVK